MQEYDLNNWSDFPAIIGGVALVDWQPDHTGWVAQAFKPV